MFTRGKKRKLPEIAGGYLLTHEVLNLSKKRKLNKKVDQIEYLSQFISKKPPKKKVSDCFKEFKRSMGSKFLLRKEHSVDMQALVIYLRHGTLKSDELVLRSLTQIEKLTGIRPCSQLKIYQRWRQRGFVIVNIKRKGYKQMLTREQVDYIIQKVTLEEMSHLSLRKRALLIKEKFHLQSFSHVTLQKYYKRYGIKYKRPDYRYWKNPQEINELRCMQYNYVREMVDLMAKGTYHEIIYIDETTFNLW
jgi:transposase